jgi:hypothetical protein
MEKLVNIEKRKLENSFKSKQKIREEFGHALGFVGNSSASE